jgi:hypothetical protein
MLTLYSFLLVRHPRVLAKLRSEIEAMSAGRNHRRLNRTDLQDLGYLQNILTESEFLVSTRSQASLVSSANEI